MKICILASIIFFSTSLIAQQDCLSENRKKLPERNFQNIKEGIMVAEAAKAINPRAERNYQTLAIRYNMLGCLERAEAIFKDYFKTFKDIGKRPGRRDIEETFYDDMIDRYSQFLQSQGRYDEAIEWAKKDSLSTPDQFESIKKDFERKNQHFARKMKSNSVI